MLINILTWQLDINSFLMQTDHNSHETGSRTFSFIDQSRVDFKYIYTYSQYTS